MKNNEKTVYHLSDPISVDGVGYLIGDLTYRQLACRHCTGRAVQLRGDGIHKEYAYRNGVVTAIGDIEENQWMSLVKCLVREKYEEERLYGQVLEYISGRIPWARTGAEREFQALEMMADRLFDNENWVDYLYFNRKYRPEVLQAVQTVKILPECCKHEGEIIKARFDQDNRTESEKKELASFCPWCGKWTRIKLV